MVEPSRTPFGLEHGYGDRVTILEDPYARSLLARIGHPETGPTEVRALLRSFYRLLLGVALAREFPTVPARIETRMAARTEKGYYEGPILDPGTRVVVAAVVRAGVLPSELCYEILCHVLDPRGLRLDYLSMNRETDAKGRVVGTRDSGCKIGGPIRGSILLIPDPMGATGGTISRVLEIYEEQDKGPAAKILALPMISTPEFMRHLSARHPECGVYTGRLDRGLSTQEALAHPPGFHEGERGLDDTQYIVPGAGGVGEVLTNAWV